eukprot:COSAG05_NODE_15234_length_375_cov_0.543478_1_plen_57_part_01
MPSRLLSRACSCWAADCSHTAASANAVAFFSFSSSDIGDATSALSCPVVGSSSPSAA